MNQDILTELAPSGTLRAGINMSNFLLVTGRATALSSLRAASSKAARSPGMASR